MGFIGPAQGFDKPPCDRTMFIPIQPNMPLQIVLELGQLPLGLSIQLFDDALKHRRQQIFSPKRKGGGNRADIATFNDGKRMLHKFTGSLRDPRRCDRGADWNPPAKFAQEIVDDRRARPALLHRTMVDVEMTCEPAMAIDIGLLGQNDLVDQAAGSGVHRGDPRHFHAADSLLKRLEQGHEVPNGKDVMLHESQQSLRPIHLPIDSVMDQFVSQGSEFLFEFLDGLQNAQFR